MTHSRRPHLRVYVIAALIMTALVAVATTYVFVARARHARSQQNGMAEAAEARTRVRVCRVPAQPLVDILKLPGTVEASEDIDLAARMSGAIEWIGPREGDRVTKGERLLQLDVDDVKARLVQARTACDLAERKFTRAQDLHERNVIAQEHFDDARAAMETARAELDAAKVELAYGTLHSPIDGVLDRLDVDVGEHIQLGQTVMKIVCIDRVEVMLDVPEKDVSYFKRGQTARLEATSGRECELEGTIDAVALTADPHTRTYRVKVLADNPDHSLRAGMIVRASLVRRHVERAVAVPFFTLVERESGKAVYVVEDDVARERAIEYGFFQGGMVEIVSGLNVGETLVVVGHRNLSDGQAVEVEADLTTGVTAWLARGGDLDDLSTMLHDSNAE